MDRNVFIDFPKRTALVHEWFTPWSVGGAEKVVEAIDSCLSDLGVKPELFALVDGESCNTGTWLSGRSIQTSFVQHLPFGVDHVQKYLPLLPFAIEQLDFDQLQDVPFLKHLENGLMRPELLH